MKKRKKAIQNGASTPDAFADMLQPNLQMAASIMSPMVSANIALLTWHAKYCERLAQGYKQWFDFVGHRLEEDAALAAQMQEAKGSEEVAQVCSSFVERAAKDYQAEISELTKLTGDISNDATDALQDMSIPPEVGATMGE